MSAHETLLFPFKKFVEIFHPLNGHAPMLQLQKKIQVSN